MNPIVLSNEERKELYDRLAKAIEDSGLTFNEYIFASAELLKSAFWVGQSAGKEDEELLPLRERISGGINGTMQALEGTTENIAEDMIVLSTVMLEAVNHIILQTRLEDEAAEAEEATADEIKVAE